LLNVEHITEHHLTDLESQSIPTKVKYLIFDQDEYTVKEVFNLLEHSNHKRFLSLFSPKTGKIITGGEVFN
jgi:hypothetical protein